MAESPINVCSTLEEVYSDAMTALHQGERWEHLKNEFQRHFGRAPTHIARAPGRVNLIGEHIDYALFGVFPAAVERDILIAVAPNDEDSGRVEAENLDDKYSRQTFAPTRDSLMDWDLDIDKTQLRWESYVKAGYHGVLGKFFHDHHSVPKGIDILVTGSVPAGSGLSSSAAMVVASILGFLAVNDKLDGLTKADLVNMSVENERRVGVNSGGMDQSASIISSALSALYVQFSPSLQATPIPLPITSPRSVFVCANSLVVSDKVVHSRTRYNLRVVETLVAARILARHLGLSIDNEWKITLREVLGLWAKSEEGGSLQVDEDVEALKTALEQIGEHLDCLKLQPGYGTDGSEIGVTMDEMVDLSGLDPATFQKVYLSWVDVEAKHFQLYKRTKHIFSEAWRVLQFRALCLRDSQSSDSSSDTTLQELGKLMDQSQESCDQLYDCSCPELNQLTKLAKEAGAYGSRLTGAGWGGCTVSLVEESRVDEFIAKVKQGYPPYHGLEGEALSEVIFATKPGSGACIFKV